MLHEKYYCALTADKHILNREFLFPYLLIFTRSSNIKFQVHSNHPSMTPTHEHAKLPVQISSLNLEFLLSLLTTRAIGMLTLLVLTSSLLMVA